MDIQAIINGRLGVNLGHIMGRFFPPYFGAPIASAIGGFLSSRTNLPMVQAVRANQWVVSNCSLSDIDLNNQVKLTFQNTAKAIYTFARVVNNPTELDALVKMPEELYELLESAIRTKKGFVVAGIHLGNFDLALVSSISKYGQLPGAHGMAITVADIPKGYAVQNTYRMRDYFKIVPASIEALRLAGGYLDSGGIVVTGIDRPVKVQGKHRPRFFGLPSNLPVFHVSIALRYRVPVLVVGLLRNKSGTYNIVISEMISMRTMANRNDELIYNAEKILYHIEELIRDNPEHWAMFFPVWPEVISKVKLI